MWGGLIAEALIVERGVIQKVCRNSGVSDHNLPRKLEIRHR
jgi:hypothetical protein